MNRITWARGTVRWALTTLIAGVVLFVPAGRFDMPYLWGYVIVCSVLTVVVILAMDPDLARERKNPGPGGLDKSLRRAAAPLWVGSLVLGSADAGRLHWSDTVPQIVRLPAFIVFAFGMALPVWAIGVNRFFSPVVRIQAERGHHLIRMGPYGYIRHPGYAGMLFGSLGGALAIGSWLGLVPILVFACLILRRVIIEDSFLKQHLEGYAEYGREVRWRLVPGLW